MSRKHINLTELDFDGIKSNLINFLSSQDEFKDYNFEGSTLNILTDILSVNSHYYAMYTNMMANEMFLDSAQLRSSVSSHAKTLGYIPRSVQASKAIVDLTLDGVPGVPSSILVPRGYTFTTSVDDVSRTFVTMEDVYLAPTGTPGQYNIPSIEIFEGKIGTFSYTVNGLDTQRFIIPTNNVDTRNIRVIVQYSSTNTYKEVYTLASKILDLDGNSKVFFIQESSDGNWEILFGDGVLGYQPIVGNVILIEYLIPTPGAGNDASEFDIQSPIFSGATHTITTITPSSGGVVREDIESIRLNAKRNFASQERNVTPFDYETNIRIDFPTVLDVKAWGGEDNEPPIYGKMFISILNTGLTKLTQSQKQEITNLIKKRNVINIRPEIVDPELESIKLVGHIRYNERLLDIQPNDLKTNVINAIQQYSKENLEKFDKMFSYTEMLKYISSADKNIISADFKFYPGLYINIREIAATFNINFRNSISKLTVTSDAFLIKDAPPNTLYYLGDDGNGKINVYSVVSGDINTKEIVPGDFGTVNYETGNVVINNFTAILLNDTVTLKIECKTENQEFIPYFNQILFIDPETLKVEVIPS